MKNDAAQYVVVDAEGRHLSRPLPLEEANKKMNDLSKQLLEKKGGVGKPPLTVKQLLLETV